MSNSIAPSRVSSAGYCHDGYLTVYQYSTPHKTTRGRRAANPAPYAESEAVAGFTTL
jgi:hypothetical protein